MFKTTSIYSSFSYDTKFVSEPMPTVYVNKKVKLVVVVLNHLVLRQQ